MKNKDINTLAHFLISLNNLNMFNSHPELQSQLTSLLKTLLPDLDYRHTSQEEIKNIINSLYPIDKE